MSMLTLASRARWLILLTALVLVGCSTAPVQKGEPIEPIFAAERVLSVEREDETYHDDRSQPGADELSSLLSSRHRPNNRVPPWAHAPRSRLPHLAK